MVQGHRAAGRLKRSDTLERMLARRDPAPGAGELGVRLDALIRTVPDFPRPGVMFRDITTLLATPDAFAAAVEGMAAPHTREAIDLVAGVESRGFILGAPVAHLLGAGFIPVRKQGRLPAATISTAYALEYGEAVLEMHADAVAPGQRVLIVDDLLATGGTAAATIGLVERLGGIVAGLAFLIELTDLRGAAALGDHRHTSLVTY